MLGPVVWFSEDCQVIRSKRIVSLDTKVFALSLARQQDSTQTIASMSCSAATVLSPYYRKISIVLDGKLSCRYSGNPSSCWDGHGCNHGGCKPFFWLCTVNSLSVRISYSNTDDWICPQHSHTTAHHIARLGPGIAAETASLSGVLLHRLTHRLPSDPLDHPPHMVSTLHL